MPSSIDFEKFTVIKKDNEKCDFEVTFNAMDYYKKYYPCYNNDKWESKPFQNSIYVYYSSNEEERKEYENNKYKTGYCGAGLLVNENKKIALTADILTSIYKPFMSVIFTDKLIDGEGLSNLFKNMDIREYLKGKEVIYPYMKAFASVYYWCGNMMPVICNWRGGNDEAVYKIEQLIKDEVKVDYFKKMKNGEINGWNVKPKELLPSWRQAMWPNWKDFIKDNYFEDYIENNCIKQAIPLWYNCKNDCKKKEWFLINTKLIIQRSYRIIKLFNGEWDKDNTENVQEIFKEVFKQAGLDYENNEELKKIIELF